MRAALLTFALVALPFAGCIAAQPEAEPSPPADDARPPAAPSPACPARPTPTSSGSGQTGVSNQPGSFSYGGQSTAKTAKETYVWQNPAAAASIQFGAQVATGSIRLILHDACDQEMFSSLREGPGSQTMGGPTTTSAGTPGAWLITLDFEAFTGQLALQASAS